MHNLLLGAAVFAASAANVHGLVIKDVAPGPVACATLATLMGTAKVQQPLSIQMFASRLDYWNAKLSGYSPACAIYPTTSQEVSSALKAIKAAKSRFAIKTGGHNTNTFFASVQDGVLIDMKNMNVRTYDAATNIGTYEPGGVFGDIYDYFQQFNRTVLGARLHDIGTGLVLGGGLSYLSGQYGLACDTFRELEVVLPSGDIVTASPTQNPDLFFAERGGGGNAYGVVTKYTVQTVPSGTFYAGNIYYAFSELDQLTNAMYQFAAHNTDPKAAIIGTVEKFDTPGIFNLDQIFIIFLVYDGPDAGSAFDMFTSIPHLTNTLSQKTYPEVIKMPFPLVTELSRGDNQFRVKAFRTDDDNWRNAVHAWNAWCESNKGLYQFSSLDFQPIQKFLTDASNAQNGGNAMQMPDGPYVWLNFLITTPPWKTADEYNAIQQSFKDMINSIPNSPGLPLFLNDAHYDQNPLSTYSTYSRLQAIKKKYDPDNFFVEYTGGWSFQ
ncbi:FAD-binding domain-containing protein [Myriangium duriaei CBS 260.36]|uniref:FAD-binding domain-containing protein n=1 Tax=Myriangium duriaei CBS 260.36 TaxID=1168546 RepID=A0A9P4J8B3_9PEZI|nr:FAD-binding domain-containing protein [Myriangium duriaei CBS 260.36]